MSAIRSGAGETAGARRPAAARALARNGRRTVRTGGAALAAARSPRRDDPRVVRTRTAAMAAARTLFLRHGYAGTTMEDIAAAAGITKRTLYNNYADKDELFTCMVQDVVAYADAFVADLRAEFGKGVAAGDVRPALEGLGRRLALGIVRAEVVALRRLLIGEARTFPRLARQYYRRAPGQVIGALAEEFERLADAGLLHLSDARRAAAQFAYLVAGESLDRAVLVGTVPSRRRVEACARDGVDTFAARYVRMS